MNVYDREYKSLCLRLGFAMLLMFVLLQGLMTLLGLGQLLFEAFLTEKVSNVLYWGLYCVFYFVSFLLPVPFFALISRKEKPQRTFFDIRFPKYFWLLAIACVGLTLAAGQINSLLLAPFTGQSESTDILLDLISSDRGYMVVLVFVMIVIVPPFCEELLFRGLVLGNLLPYGKGIAIVGSALLFAAMHQNFSQFLYTAVAGILLGLLYTQSRSIWPSTVVHMLNNLLSFLQMVIMARVQDEMLANRVLLCMNLLAMFAGLVCVLVLVLLHKSKPEKPVCKGSLFGTVPDRSYFEKDRELSPGMAIKGLLSPSVAVFLVISLVMAFINLVMERML